MAWPFRTPHPDLPADHEIVTRVLVADEDGPVAMTLMKRGQAKVLIDGKHYTVKVERVARKRKQLAIEA